MSVVSKLIAIIMLCLTSALYAAPHPKESPQTLITEDKTTFSVSKTSPDFTMKIKSNPTTGYSWFLREYDKDLIEPVSQTFEANTNKKLMGAPGYEWWHFKVKASAFKVPQQTTIRLSYARPWENADQVKQLVFRIFILAEPRASHS